jgi:RimJ/RimL family protein N-acetyltransferase
VSEEAAAPLMLTTPRLVLRPFTKAHPAPFAAMMADPEVGEWLGGVMTAEAAGAWVDRVVAHLDQHGFSFLAVERLSDGAFLGAAGLVTFRDDHPLAPGVEIGWRLARAAWGAGYATEAARALLADGFARLPVSEIIAYTAWSNVRSQAVMTRLGFTRRPERDFDHPNLAADNPLRPHVVYALPREAWAARGEA